MGWRQRQARKPERNIKLISVLQFSVLSFKKKKPCVFMSVSPGRKLAVSPPRPGIRAKARVACA